MTRQCVVVDCETTGLDPQVDVVVEISWWNLSTGEHGCFVPVHNVAWVLGDPDHEVALELNGYRRRLANAPQDVDGSALKRLAGQLDGATLAGSNPTFDVGFLGPLLAGEGHARGWHHRLLDVSAFAAGRLGLVGNQPRRVRHDGRHQARLQHPRGFTAELPGLYALAALLNEQRNLDIPPPDHTATGDVRTTGLCLRALGPHRPGVPPPGWPLSGREWEVFSLLPEHSNCEIARAVGVSEDTVKTRLRKAFKRLGAESRTEAVAVGFRRGWLT